MAQLEIPPPKLVIEPFEYVLVEPPFNEPKHWKLRLVNPHSRSIIFKIKTTAATEFGVKPRVGVLAPNAESSIRFTLLHRPDRPAPTPEFISKQLFQLHSRYPVDNELSDIAAIDDPQDPKRAEALINDLFKKQHPTLPFTMPCFVGKDNVTANPPPRGKGLDSISVASSFASTALPPPSARQGGLQHSASVGSMDLAAATASHGSVAASRSGTLQRLDSMRRARAAAQASAAKAWGGGAAAAPDAALVTSLLAKVADLAKVRLRCTLSAPRVCVCVCQRSTYTSVSVSGLCMCASVRVLTCGCFDESLFVSVPACVCPFVLCPPHRRLWRSRRRP